MLIKNGLVESGYIPLNISRFIHHACDGESKKPSGSEFPKEQDDLLTSDAAGSKFIITCSNKDGTQSVFITTFHHRLTYDWLLISTVRHCD